MGFEARERLVDLLLFSIPVFLVVGVVALSARFWLWIVGLDACFR
jgi:hypothetical protein